MRQLIRVTYWRLSPAFKWHVSGNRACQYRDSEPWASERAEYPRGELCWWCRPPRLRLDLQEPKTK